MSEQEFLRRLQATFRIEAAEHLQAIGAGLLELERSAAPAEEARLIETIFRAAHSLKGAARAVNLTEIESVCQSLESLFSSWKRRDSQPTAAALDLAHRDVDKMSQAIASPAPVEHAAPSPVATRAGAREPQAAVTLAAAQTRMNEGETVRIAVSSLDMRLLEAEEMLAAKLAVEGRAAELGWLTYRFERWRKEWSRVEPGLRALRKVNGNSGGGSTTQAAVLADFLEWNHDYLRGLEEKVTALRRAADQDRMLVGKLVDDLLENSKKLLMMPVSTLSGLLAKVVRDLCRDQGKEAEFSLRGEEVTLDKRILEELKDPLIHLLRNAIDHGIEVPSERRSRGKPARATIALTVVPANGNQVDITVSDDGAGINLEHVKAAAGQRGLVDSSSSSQSADAATLALVFEPDISTSQVVTEVSGRGLGLAIVREKTEKLGGRVTLESQPNAGTTIRMRLPLTLSTFRGVLIRAMQRLFVVPTSHVERVLQFRTSDVQTVEGRPTLSHQGRALALADLAQVLQLPRMKSVTPAPEATPALILSVGEQRVAFAVEAVIDEREVLVKQLAKPLSRVRNIAGATVLSSGEVAPILNVQDLLKSVRAGVGTLPQAPTAPSPAALPARKRILVVEDSVTSRMLLKGILESAGYQVRTAVDGIEAFTALRLERFDLVVSDVEMPRMNGFDLTARIRAERTLADLPVVLVTALAAQEDRKRGIDVGANAYLVKSSFDQSDLLETLRRLA